MHWLHRDEQSMIAARKQMRSWTRVLLGELRHERPDAIQLHYSVFSYSYRGLPVFILPLLSALRATGTPVVTVLHEFAYPWGRQGVRGAAWALSQRTVLIEVMRKSAAAVVTTDVRSDWLASRRWLSRRPVRFAPVFSNLPPPSAPRRPHRRRPVIGLFGYSHEGTAMQLVLEALRLLQDRGRPVDLMLLGAPGRDSRLGERWLTRAHACAVDDSVSFSGVLGAQALSDALAACDLLLCAEHTGPTARKTTLAASLASGTAVVAIDGPRSWPEVTRSALELVPPSAGELARAVAALLDDPRSRDALGARGREFAERRMSSASSASVHAALLRELLPELP
jgi:glycosyltransferase involved in cell wall biosynthesis